MPFPLIAGLAAKFALPAAVKALPWKWILIGALALVLVTAGWRAWAWVDGMRDTIAAQKEQISAKDQAIGGLRQANRTLAETANHNAAELAAEQTRHQATMNRLAQNRRDHQRRESRLEEGLNAIDKWSPDMDGAIGPGLRGTLDGLRRNRADRAAGGDAGAGGVHHGP